MTYKLVSVSKRFRNPITSLVTLIIAGAGLISGCGGADNALTVLNSLEKLSTINVEKARAALIDQATAAGLSNAEANALAQSRVKHPIGLYKFNYETTGPDGLPAKASALLMVPEGAAKKTNAVIYLHGTTTQRQYVPSAGDYDENVAPALLIAAAGHTVISPDYLGLGQSNLSYHPYYHRDSLARSARDAFISGMALGHFKGPGLSGAQYVIGYSEGGYVAAALTDLLKKEPIAGEMPKGVFSIAGALDLEHSARQTMAYIPSPGDDESQSLYVAFVTFAYQKIYGNFYIDAKSAYTGSYGSLIDSLFDGSKTPATIAKALPASPNQLLTPTLVSDIANWNLANPFVKHLNQNLVLQTPPDVSFTACHGTADTSVLYSNVTRTAQRFAAAGKSLNVIELPGATHTSAFLPCMLQAAQLYAPVQ